MYIATLLCDPARPCLEPALAESLRNAWGGDDVVWLMPDVAAEFTLSALPGNVDEVWQDLQALGIDLVVGPLEGRRKTLLLADMDSTMIEQECIDELADQAGVGKRVADITARAMNGELDFEAALRGHLADQPNLRRTAAHAGLFGSLVCFKGPVRFSQINNMRVAIFPIIQECKLVFDVGGSC